MGWSLRRTTSLGLYPSDGLYDQGSVLDTRQLQPRESSAQRVSPLGTLCAVIVVGLLLYGISSSAPANASSAPVIPVMQAAAPIGFPVTVTHVVKRHKARPAFHRRAQVLSLEPDDRIAAEPMDAVLD